MRTKGLMKRRLAALLAALLVLPAQPATIAFGQPVVQMEEVGQNDESLEENLIRATLSNAAAMETLGDSQSGTGPMVSAEPASEIQVATMGNALQKHVSTDMVKFNTGNYVVSVVEEDAFEDGYGDVPFEEDGSYTINIPEENPFFPYEVQFTYDGKTSNEWFMTPDDSVEIGDHTFYVSAYFDGSVVTQMSFEVAGDIVTVYPEEKQFTDGDGAMLLSLLPLEQRNLTVDLTGYTPVELTRVSLYSMFTGVNEIPEDDLISCRHTGTDSNEIYDVVPRGGMSDISLRTWNQTSNVWEMIVGDVNQLAGDNIRYFVTIKTTKSRNWLIPTVSYEGNTLTTVNPNYADYSRNSRRLDVPISKNETGVGIMRDVLVKLEVNPEVFTNTNYDRLEVYAGNFGPSGLTPTAEDNITDEIFGSGVPLSRLDGNRRITIYSYKSDGSNDIETGCLPMRLQVYKTGNHTFVSEFRADTTGAGGERNWINWDWEEDGEESEFDTYVLEYGYPANGQYYVCLEYDLEGGTSRPDLVTAAYVGVYESIAEAQAAGAVDIHQQLFDTSGTGGYKADYSQGLWFSVFVGGDGSDSQEVYHVSVKTKEGSIRLNNSPVQFWGLVDGNQNPIECYVVEKEYDSYGEYNYPTILVGKDVDLSNLAPTFSTQRGVKLYTGNSTAQEVSGVTYHDFSSGPVQYTVSADDGISAKNYWLQVVKAEDGDGTLYMNSFADDDAETRSQDEVVYTTREMFLDGRYDYLHSIFVANLGTAAIADLSAEIVSDEVRLDPYWTFNGNYQLDGFTSLRENERKNLARLVIVPKDGADDGREISGTLTIKSGDTPLVVMTLKGVAGDPGIVTEQIPAAVKYVHYGTVIQNSNKYDWNKVSYSISSGELPNGMILKPNGELYGVPTETGDFTFTVSMINSYSDFGTCEKSFTLTVTENTDANVEAATDMGYELTQRVQDFAMNSATDQTMVSEGLYEEFVDVYLDGGKLIRGTEYDAESGSTRITIRSQTLKAHNTPGVHTISAEFRTREDNTLKRAAQNYYITDNGGGSGSDSSDSNSYGDSGSVSRITRDSKKGYVDSMRGIITGSGVGYSYWVQDGRGWKLIYADGTTASGYKVQRPDGTTVEQVLWEKINGSWYAFGADGNLKSGWVFDYQLDGWYLLSTENGMQSGWYKDSQDGYMYYLDTTTGKLAAGWKLINNRWYYFNGTPETPTYVFNEETGNWVYNTRSTSMPYGSLYRNGRTPDGYFVDQNGIWDGKERR